MNYMNKKLSKQTGAGSPENTSPPRQAQPGLSPLGQQILIGLLTRRQVAQRWNCATHTVARRKDLRPVRLGRRLLRYRLSDVEEIEAAAIAGK
jgi:hypothetical protein